MRISFIEFLILAFMVGLPGPLLQLYLSKRETRKLHKSSLWLTWSAFQTELAETLHHPHVEAQEMDRLLEKLQTFTVSGLSTISEEDRAKLMGMLKQKANDTKADEADRVRAKFLLTTMPKVRKKQEAGRK